MARIKLTLPNHFSFLTKIPVRITDLNYGGHLGNDSLLSLLHETRMQFLQQFGYSETNLDGLGMIMADAAIEFKTEAFFGDALVISIAATEFSRVSFEFYYKVEKQTEGKVVLVARAKTGMVCYDYQERKVAPIPETVLQKLKTD